MTEAPQRSERRGGGHERSYIRAPSTGPVQAATTREGFTLDLCASMVETLGVAASQGQPVGIWFLAAFSHLFPDIAAEPCPQPRFVLRHQSPSAAAPEGTASCSPLQREATQTQGCRVQPQPPAAPSRCLQLVPGEGGICKDKPGSSWDVSSSVVTREVPSWLSAIYMPEAYDRPPAPRVPEERSCFSSV